MKNSRPNYPYIDANPQSRAHIALGKTFLPPLRVMSSRMIDEPDNILQGRPVTFDARHHEAHLVIDFGSLVVGGWRMSVMAQDQADISIYYGESLHEVFIEKPIRLKWYTLPVDHFNLAPGHHDLHPACRRAFRFMRICVTKGTVSLTKLDAEHNSYPVQQQGSFSCSDTLVNDIWHMSRDTTHACMQHYYEDGVKRDGLLWIGDYRIQFLCNEFTLGDIALAKKSLFLMAASQRDDGAIPACAGMGGGHQHPDNINYLPGVPHGFASHWILVNYCADFLSTLHDYWMYTDDVHTVKLLHAAAKRLAAYLLKINNCETLRYHHDFLLDHVVENGYNWGGSHCALISIVAEGFQRLGALANEVWTDTPLSAACDRESRRLRAVVNSHFFSKPHGYFVERNSKAKGPAWHPSAFAISCEVADKPLSAIKKLLASDNIIAAESGYSSFRILDALGRAGLAREALDYMRSYWGLMHDHGATTCWERLDTRNPVMLHKDALTSRCHGWSAGPAYALPRYITGISPIAPGFASVQICPRLGDLAWAEATIPTPRGKIFVHVEKDKRAVCAHVTIPEGMTAEFMWPGSRRKKQTLHSGEHVIHSKENHKATFK